MSMYDVCSRCGQKEQGRCWTCDPYQGKEMCGLHLLECVQAGHKTVIVFAEGITPPTQRWLITSGRPSLWARACSVVSQQMNDLLQAAEFIFVRRRQMVYIVFIYDCEGNFLHSAWATERLAQEEADRLNAAHSSQYPGQYSGQSYGIEVHEIKS